jgi:hypothetical protein
MDKPEVFSKDYMHVNSGSIQNNQGIRQKHHTISIDTGNYKNLPQPPNSFYLD